MFNYFKTLWHQLLCPSPEEILEYAYSLPNAEDSIAYFEEWLPWLSDYNKGELFKQMSFDLAFSFSSDTYSDKLFDWLLLKDPNG